MNMITKNTTSKKENGFGVIEAILVLLLLGVIAFAGFFVLNRQDDQAVDTSNQSSQQQEETEINDAEDLQSAEENLNDINMDELDSTELDEAEADLL